MQAIKLKTHHIHLTSGRSRPKVFVRHFLFVVCLAALQAYPLVAQQLEHSFPLAPVNEYQGMKEDHNSFTLFVYPSSHPLDYQSPSSVLWSIIGIEVNRFLWSRSKISFTDARGETRSISVPYTSSIGHVIAHMDCMLPDSSIYDQWVSLSSHQYTKTSLRMLVKEKSGLAFLFHAFPDGFLLMDEENVLRLVHYRGARTNGESEESKRKQPRYVAFQVATSQCAAMKEMVDFFNQLQENVYQDRDAEISNLKAEDKLYFGSALDPFESYQRRISSGEGKVGGGCAPFGVALIKVAGYHHPILDSLWMRPFHVSENLIGNEQKSVSVSSLMFGKLGQSWSHRNYPDRNINIYDPDGIWLFIGNLQEKLLKGEPVDTSISEWLEDSGLTFEKGEVVPLAIDIPSLTYDPFWLYKPFRKMKRSMAIQGVRMNKLPGVVPPAHQH